MAKPLVHYIFNHWLFFFQLLECECNMSITKLSKFNHWHGISDILKNVAEGRLKLCYTICNNGFHFHIEVYTMTVVWPNSCAPRDLLKACDNKFISEVLQLEENVARPSIYFFSSLVYKWTKLLYKIYRNVWRSLISIKIILSWCLESS